MAKEYHKIDGAPPNPFPGFGRITKGGRGDWHDVFWTTYWVEGVVVYSKRCADIMLEEGITGLEFHPFTFVESENKKLKIKNAPEYVWGRTIGKIGIKKYIETGEENSWHPETNSYKFPSKRNISFLLDIDDWDGSDFVTPPNYGAIFVSQKVVDTAREHQITNFGFEVLEDYNGWSTLRYRNTLDYFSKK